MDDQTQQPIEDLDVESHELRETPGVPDETGAEQAVRGRPFAATSDDDGDTDVEGHRVSRYSDVRLKQHIRLI